MAPSIEGGIAGMVGGKRRRRQRGALAAASPAGLRSAAAARMQSAGVTTMWYRSSPKKTAWVSATDAIAKAR